MSDPEALLSMITDVINNQIRDATPPETKHTYDRLLEQGHSEEEVMILIGHIVFLEIFSVLKEGKTYDEKRFVTALRALPRLP
jgi:hypothetical protein